VVKWFKIPGSNPPFYHHLNLFSVVPNSIPLLPFVKPTGEPPTNWDS